MIAPKKFRRRDWRSTPELEPRLCRTPWKRVYTKIAAKDEVRRLRKLGMRMYIYDCDCRWFHLTSSKQEVASDS